MIINTTGAYLVPMEVQENGTLVWRWVVKSFNDDTYNTQGQLVSPTVSAARKDELLIHDKNCRVCPQCSKVTIAFDSEIEVNAGYILCIHCEHKWLRRDYE